VPVASGVEHGAGADQGVELRCVELWHGSGLASVLERLDQWSRVVLVWPYLQRCGFRYAVGKPLGRVVGSMAQRKRGSLTHEVA